MRGRIAAMPRECVHLKLPSRFLAFAVLALMCVAIAAAQESPRLRTSSTPRLIILPYKVVAGADATLAVLDSQGRLLPNVAVELPGGQQVTTDATGRAMFKAPNQSGTMVARASGLSIMGSTDVILPEGPVTPSGSSAAAKIDAYPRILAIHDRFNLDGSGFRGAADSNHVYLNGDPCLVVASSPISLVALPGPHVPIGEVSLQVTVGGTDAGQFSVSAVLLEISGPTAEANAGSIGELLVRVRGTTEPLLLEVRNGSPAVIQLAKGNVQRLKTSGGNRNSAPIELKFVTAGNYFVSARVLSADAGKPDLESARERLTEARKIASGEWSARIDRILSKIDRAPQDLPKIRAELKSMLDDKPTGPLASLLDSAWRVLN